MAAGNGPIAGAENPGVGTVVGDLARGAPPGAFDRSPIRNRDRQLMRASAMAHGFAHAIDSLANVVAVEVTGGMPEDAVDRVMAEVADETERAVIDAMVRVAQAHGWRGAS
jgi:hypothetical protein